MMQYDARAGQYRDLTTGRFVRKPDVMRVVDSEQQRLKAELQAHTRALIAEQLDVAQWQVRCAESMRASHIRIGALGSGGIENMTPAKYGAIGWQLRNQYEYLSRFAVELAEGFLTPSQALVRVGMYSSSIRPSFHRCEQLTRQDEGFKTAKRSLDPVAQHCSSCIGYSTQGRYVDINDVVMPGTACECRQNCRCQVEYSKFTMQSFSAQIAG